MRFWATIRSPAFSINALTAPVRLRSVASGLMIEKVRSIAIALRPYKTLGGELRGLYRRHLTTASGPVTRLPPHLVCFRAADAPRGRRLQQFHGGEPCLKPPCRLHSASRP
jgi:hypothetical protein